MTKPTSGAREAARATTATTATDYDETIGNLEKLQDSTKDSLYKIQQQLADSQETGVATLWELKQQKQMIQTTIQNDTNRLEHQLNHTQKVQDRLSRWTLNFGGRKKAKEALKFSKHTDHTSRDSSSSSLFSSSKQDAREQIKTTTTNNNNNNKKKKSKKKGKTTNIPVDFNSTDLDYGVENEDNKQFLEHLKHNDKEIDNLLDETAAILDNLELTSKTIHQETKEQGKALSDLDKQLNRVSRKQETVNIRTRHFLTGKWKRQNS